MEVDPKQDSSTIQSLKIRKKEVELQEDKLMKRYNCVKMKHIHSDKQSCGALETKEQFTFVNLVFATCKLREVGKGELETYVTKLEGLSK